MRRLLSWRILAAGSGLLLLLLAAVVLLPAVVYPALSGTDLHGVAAVSNRVDLQNARYALQNDFRGQLIQILAALFVVAGAAATWALSWRSGLKSSRIQNARPNVAATSWPSRMSRSRTEAVGRFSCSDCHSLPSLKDTKAPFSVPA